MTRLLLLTFSLLVLAWPSSSAAPRPNPVLTPVTKDPSTSLYTIPLSLYSHLVVDLAGPLVWSTCADDHLPAQFPCRSPTCKLANAYPVPGCPDAGCDKVCKAYPYNPVTGRCAAGALIHTRFIANTTDGKTPLTQVSIRAVAACAPKKLLASLPAGVTGLAGLAGSGLALPAQVVSSQNVAKKFMLCLPRSGYGNGAAIFGGGPFYLDTGLPDFTQSLEYVPLLSKKDNPAYYISVKSIAVNESRLQVPERALATGGVVLCTRVPYTLLRRDIYRPVVDAFEREMRSNIVRPVKVKAVAPFELCYDSRKLANTRLGYLVPRIDLVLEGGKVWSVLGMNSMVDVNKKTACLAFVEMKGVKAGDGRAPAVLIGGYQMENYLLQFDLEKRQLGFTKLLYYTSCSNFNFTRSY